MQQILILFSRVQERDSLHEASSYRRNQAEEEVRRKQISTVSFGSSNFKCYITGWGKIFSLYLFCIPLYVDSKI